MTERTPEFAKGEAACAEAMLLVTPAALGRTLAMLDRQSSVAKHYCM